MPKLANDEKRKKQEKKNPVSTSSHAAGSITLSV